MESLEKYEGKAVGVQIETVCESDHRKTAYFVGTLVRDERLGCYMLKDKVGSEEVLVKRDDVKKIITLKYGAAGVAKISGLIIHEEKCNGCGNCVVACPANVSLSRKVAGGKGPGSDKILMQVIDGKSEGLNLDMCRRFGEPGDPLLSCTVCADVCPTDAIEFV